MLRGEVAATRELGREVKAHMAAGHLAPDELVTRAVVPTLEGRDGYVLDGYPRTLSQATGLDFDAVVYLNVPDDEVERRLLARGREDDTPEAIKERLREYAQDTKPLVEHYRDVLVEVDGDRPEDEIAAELEDRLTRPRPALGTPASARAARRSDSTKCSTSGSCSPVRTAARICRDGRAAAQRQDDDVRARARERHRRDQRHADPRRRHPLQRLVVVGREAHVRLEAGVAEGVQDDVGVRARARHLGDQERLVAQLLERDRRARGQRVVGGDRDAQLVVADRQVLDARARLGRVRARTATTVATSTRPASSASSAGSVLEHLQRQLGVRPARAQLARRARQQPGGGRRERGHAHLRAADAGRLRARPPRRAARRRAAPTRGGRAPRPRA